ncbi:hypothetical protein CYLTODRAFT_341053 [Cylindrobasidium torrendii FP15055 ss-10]|uniref:Uncharacterized protein n=1 Tax=Cylindrobasidium torrendii FP15055 ss-10 TaxID=1314674 RepID=A0A0D7BW94_9AGAR|nr:hypothetical protein CYLTODRAFT_341053 [Cylindrobasidium torrendii FP15055 ss-10]
MQSKVGNSQVYNDGDQRPAQTDVGQHFEGSTGGQRNAHDLLDSKDQRSIGNKLNIASQQEHQDEEPSLSQRDPTAPAKAHGNEPSRGAKIDAELKAEEEELLKKKSS